MIAADSSTWVAYLQGQRGDDIQLLDEASMAAQVFMPPVVLTELLSDPNLRPDAARLLADVPLMEITAGYWERAGVLRRRVLAKGRKARLGDALIAQSCLDGGIALITRDRDFRAFSEAACLNLAAPA